MTFFQKIKNFFASIFKQPEPKTEPIGEPVKTPQEPDGGPVTSGQDKDEGTYDWYRRMWSKCEIAPGKKAQVLSTLETIRVGLPRYKSVALKLGAEDPDNFAYILGVIHFKEASCSFKGVLHNGERIIGTGRKTSLVPKGRGPFKTWEEAAVDAILIESNRWKMLLSGDCDIGNILWALERYNGTGYITGAGKADTTPYLWACSNINDGTGLYVSDGKYDPNYPTGASAGTALLLRQFFLSGEFKVV